MESESSNKEPSGKNTENGAGKITSFFPVLKPEGRAKMCVIKSGDSKQKEMVQKLKNKETMSLRSKNQEGKSISEQVLKSESSIQSKEKLSNISLQSSLKTPLSQVLRKSIEASDIKKEREKRNQSDESSQVDSSKQVKKGSSNQASSGDSNQANKPSKSSNETESRRILRQPPKPAHATKSVNAASRLSSTPKRNVEVKQGYVSRKKSEVESNDAGIRKSSATRAHVSHSIESKELKESSSPAKAKKGKKRHFRGCTYGLYLSKKKKKKKSVDDVKDDECSLAGTENSSYIDSEDGNSLVSEDFTPSEKSLADEEHNPDSRVSPMSSERKTNNESNPVVKSQTTTSDNSSLNEKNQPNESDSQPTAVAECDDISRNTTEIIKELEEMAWEQAAKFDDSLESTQFASEALKAPQYDDISNESFSNSVLFPFKTCTMENSVVNINTESNQIESHNENSSLNINSNDFSGKDEVKKFTSEISVAEENFSGMFENRENLECSLQDEIPHETSPIQPEITVETTLDDSAKVFNIEETTHLDAEEIETQLDVEETDAQLDVEETDVQLDVEETDVQLDGEETETRLDVEEDTHLSIDETDTQICIEESDAQINLEDTKFQINEVQENQIDVDDNNAVIYLEEVDSQINIEDSNSMLNVEGTDLQMGIEETHTEVTVEQIEDHLSSEDVHMDASESNIQPNAEDNIQMPEDETGDQINNTEADINENDDQSVKIEVDENIDMNIDENIDVSVDEHVDMNADESIEMNVDEIIPKNTDTVICVSTDENINLSTDKNFHLNADIHMNVNETDVSLNLIDETISTIKIENQDLKDIDSSDAQSTIANCVKSRQRIKRRFTDDIVDTDVGLLALHSSMAPSRKTPHKSLHDVIQNFQSVTHSEAKRGPINKIECIFNSRQKPIDFCTCEGDTYEANLGSDEDGVFCQAVDSIDDKLVGCSNPVVTTRLVRPSVKIPFTIMCEMHLWRLKHHHSCPYCGLFCSQGHFIQCASVKNKKKTVHLFHEQCQSKEDGIESFCLHCGSTTGMKRVQLEMQMASPPSFFLSQLGQSVPMPEVSKARISFPTSDIRKDDDESSNLTYKIEESGKILSSVGLINISEKEELEKLLQLISAEKLSAQSYFPNDFYDSASKGEVLKVVYMLGQGFDPNQKFLNHENETALHAAAAAGHTTIVHLLIQAGSVNDAFNEKVYTPLMLAVENGHKDVVHYLVKKGALVDFKGENGMCSLHLAAKNGNLDILRILMSSREIDVNSQDDGGWTPIVWASEHDHYHVVKYLLKRGANPNIKDNEGNTGLHWSAFSGSVDICYLYLDYGCDINAVNELGDTPLHIAARQDAFPCVTLFLSRAADVSIPNKANILPAECCLDKNSDTYLSLSLNMLLKRITGKFAHKAEKILHRDISRGKEQIAIQCVNMIDDEQPPLDFLYVTENCETMPIKIDRTITSLQSCHCEDDCSTANCSCSSISYQCWYDKEGLLLPEFNLVDPPMLFECNRACSCWALNCHNRVLQNGIMCRLQLIRTKGKGWGVRTLKDIPKGAFICEYVGELISDSAADKRADDSYLFDLDNRDGETYCLDARYYGNISRFINHLCEPNLVPVKIYVDHQDLNFPRIAFFSSRDIKQYEELGFDYGEKFWAIKYKFFTCDCGSNKCKYSKETIHATISSYYSRLKEEQMEEAASQLVNPEQSL